MYLAVNKTVMLIENQLRAAQSGFFGILEHVYTGLQDTEILLQSYGCCKLQVGTGNFLSKYFLGYHLAAAVTTNNSVLKT